MAEKKNSVSEFLAILGIIFGIIGSVSSVLVVPEFRLWAGLDPIKSHETSLPIQIFKSSPTPADLSNDPRDLAAQTLGYSDLDTFINAFGIPVEVKSRIFVCPNESWCLSVYEESGQADFHFANVAKCVLDGKQANGTSIIPVGFDGMIKGFTVRLCSR